MSELVQMRQRIKAIETIEKITHAMRLIAMSAHSRLKRKEAGLNDYIHTLNGLFSKIFSLNTHWHNPVINPHHNRGKMLVILVGSQKGLCGSFNTNLFSYFTLHMARYAESTFDVVVVGKKAIDFLNTNHRSMHIINQYSNFSLRNIFILSQTIADSIIHAHTPYSSVILFSNELKGFFLQKPLHTKLIPLATTTNAHQPAPTEGYLWEHDVQLILDTIAHHYLEARIQHLLFGSLYAEQAARFLSMDNATRNAIKLLETSKLLYNKMRQAKITKELTELTGNL